MARGGGDVKERRGQPGLAGIARRKGEPGLRAELSFSSLGGLGREGKENRALARYGGTVGQSLEFRDWSLADSGQRTARQSIVYSFDRSAPEKARKAKALIREALASHKGVVSYQVVQEFFNVALRRFARPMQGHEAEQDLTAVFRPLLAVHSSAGLYAEALRLDGHGGLAWYDALVVAAARRRSAGCC